MSKLQLYPPYFPSNYIPESPLIPGKGGQALAAINAAAGVSTQIDQSTKQFGYSRQTRLAMGTGMEVFIIGMDGSMDGNFQ